MFNRMTLLIPLLILQTPADPSKAMDFWIGDWSCDGLALSADGKTWTTTKGTNHIDRILGGKVIHEKFKSGPMQGESWTVFAPKAGVWRQTWVDSQGGYIPLTGGSEGDGVTLTTLRNPKNPDAVNHMVFTDIQPESFTWNWESSKDGGKTWQLQWVLHYKRKHR